MSARMMAMNDRLIGFARDRFLSRQMAASSFPVILDDADATKYFNGGVEANCNFKNQPKTCPLITANWAYLE